MGPGSTDSSGLRVPRGRGVASSCSHSPEAPQRATANGRVASTLRGHGVDVQAAHSLVVVRTAPGHASVVADALDHSPPKECVGTIAGDDTVFIAAPSPTAAKRLAKELAAALEGAEAAR